MAVYQHAHKACLQGGGKSLSTNEPTNTSADEISPLQIAFTGHSLGAAIAVLAALDVSTNIGSICRAVHDRLEEDGLIDTPEGTDSIDVPIKLPNLLVYTFGSPRIGNKLFCDLVKKRVQTFYRVEVEGDSITMMPPNYLGFFRHCGRRVVVDPHGSGSVIVKPTIVETVLLSKSSYSIVNHSLDAYRLSLEACFEPEELAVYTAKEYHRTLQQERGKEIPSWLLK
jgi:hypothetical protein